MATFRVNINKYRCDKFYLLQFAVLFAGFVKEFGFIQIVDVLL